MIDFNNFSIKTERFSEKDKGRTRVKVVFMVDGEDEAAQLVKGCRSLGARATNVAPTPKTEEAEPAAAKPKKAPKAEEPASESPKAETKPEPAEETPAEVKTNGTPSKGTLTISKEMKEARFRGVIKMLVAQGFEDEDSLLKVCTKILDKVPALKQAGLEKLDERISLALETLEDD